MDPFSKGSDAFQITWAHLKGYAFRPFALIGLFLNKVQKEKATLLLITPSWQTQSWYPLVLQPKVRIPKTQNLLLGPNSEKHPLIEQRNLQLQAWKVSGKDCMQKELQKTLPLLSQMPEGQVKMLITNRPGVSGIAKVLKDSLIPLSVL